ncbi:MAG: hypothetical protein KIT83_15585 [Bryobacterales bacterium]|nr:hypothetical protein [Bryobacterales bacterium]
MNVRYTLFLPDGTPRRASVSAKLGLPSSLAPAVLAQEANRPTGARHHSGGVNMLFGDGSVKVRQPQPQDLSFVTNPAGRVPFGRSTVGGASLLYLDCHLTPNAEMKKFRSHLDAAVMASKRPLAKGGSDVAMEEITLAFEEVRPG